MTRSVKEVDKKRSVFSLIVVMFAYFLTNFHRQSMAVLSPIFMEELGLSTSQVGLLGSMTFYVYGFTQIPFGLFADKHGSKKVIQICLFTLIAGTYFFAHGKSFAMLIIGRLLIGFSISGFFVPSLTLIRGWFDVREYGFYLGLFMASGNLGSVMSTTPLEVLISKFSYINVLNGFVLLTVILAITSLSLYEVKLPVLKKRKKEERGGTSKEFKIFLFTLCLLSLFYNGARQSFQSLWGTSYYTEVFGFTLRRASVFMMLFSIGGIFFNPIAGKIADKTGRFNALIKLATLTAVFWILMGITPPSAPVFVIFIVALILGSLNSSTIQNSFTTISDYATADNRSLVSAIINTFGFLGPAVFTHGLGVAFENTTLNQMTFLIVYSVFAVLILIAVVLNIFTKNSLDQSLEISNKDG